MSSVYHLRKQMSRASSKLAAALVIYTCFAVYLYYPYFNRFSTTQYLLVANASLASLGCFVLSRRWLLSFWGSFFAGAIYGFGPFLLGLGRYHPVACLPAASLPWLFCPAAFAPKLKRHWLQIPLCAFAFLCIPLFFEILAYCRLFPIPIQTGFHSADIAGLLIPLVTAGRNLTPVGFYHIPIAPLMVGAFMLLAARRFGIIAIFTIGLIPAFCPPLLNVSPIIWLAFPTLCCSVLVGAGLGGLVSASSADKKWVLISTILLATLAMVTLLLTKKYLQAFTGWGPQHSTLLARAAQMYVLGTAATGIVYFTVLVKLRTRWLRLFVLCSAMAIDIFFGARFIIDKIF